MGLSFGQVVDVLSEANALSADRRERFISRLKQWQKMGFPEGVNVGKGARAVYGAKQLFQLALHMRLLALGLTPERAQAILQSTWAQMQDAITSATLLAAQGSLGGHYLLVRMDALTELKDDPSGHMHIYVQPVMGWMMADALAPGEFEGDVQEEELDQIKFGRFMIKNSMVGALVLEVDSIIWRIWLAMAKTGVSPSALTSDLQSWSRDFAKHERARPDNAEKTLKIEDNLSGLDTCLSCFAGELLGLQEEHDHAGDPQA